MSTTLTNRVRTAVEGLTPGYFALVMASGIISVGMQLEGVRVLSLLLLAVCAGALRRWPVNSLGYATNNPRGDMTFIFAE